ncbi:MAG: rhomboid family intramembrane serine protease [Flavobacteriales bacterium]
MSQTIPVDMIDFESPITIVIIIATLLISWQAFNNSSLFEKFLFNPYAVKHRKEYYRLFSHMLVHTDWIHVGFNMYVFYSFGTFMEQVFKRKYGMQEGSLLFIALYILGGLVATLPAMRKHVDNYGYNAVGASGAVSAVIMAFMVMFPTMQIRMFFAIPMPAYVGVLIFFGLEHYLQRKGRTNIAHDAHIYGALFGILFIFILDSHALVNFVQSVRTSIFG